MLKVNRIGLTALLLVLVLTSPCRGDSNSADSQQNVIKQIVTDLVKSIVGSPSDEELGKVASWSPYNVGPVSKDMLPELVDQLEDKDYKARGRAATALGLIGPDARESVPELKAHLKDKSGAVQASAAGAIWAITGKSEEMCPRLTRLLRGKHRAYHIYAASALGAVGPPAKIAIPELLETLEKDEYPGVRSAAAIALLNIGDKDPKVLQALERAGGDKDASVSEVAGKALAALKAPTENAGGDLAENAGPGQNQQTLPPSPETASDTAASSSASATQPAAKAISLSGVITYDADEAARRYGVTGGPVGTISLNVGPGLAGVEGTLSITITEKPYYAESEIAHTFNSSFGAVAGESEGEKVHFKIEARYSEKAEGAVSYVSEGDLLLEFDLLADNKAEGSITGISSWTPCQFTASPK